jgi:hypothetical protein
MRQVIFCFFWGGGALSTLGGYEGLVYGGPFGGVGGDAS